MRTSATSRHQQPRRWTTVLLAVVASAACFALHRARPDLATTPNEAKDLLGWQIALGLVAAGLVVAACADLTAPRRARRARRDAAVAQQVAIALAARGAHARSWR